MWPDIHHILIYVFWPKIWLNNQGLRKQNKPNNNNSNNKNKFGKLVARKSEEEECFHTLKIHKDIHVPFEWSPQKDQKWSILIINWIGWPILCKQVSLIHTHAYLCPKGSWRKWPWWRHGGCTWAQQRGLQHTKASLAMTTAKCQIFQ